MKHGGKGIKTKKNSQLLIVNCQLVCGGGWTRTTELIRGQIYSLLQLPLCDSPFFALQRYGDFRNPRHIFVKILKKFVMNYKSTDYR